MTCAIYVAVRCVPVLLSSIFQSSTFNHNQLAKKNPSAEGKTAERRTANDVALEEGLLEGGSKPRSQNETPRPSTSNGPEAFALVGENVE